MRFEKGKSLKNLTTLGIGGKAALFVEIRKEKEIKDIPKNSPWYVIGSGSNIIAPDKGFPGLVIKISIKDFKRDVNKIYVGAGDNLLNFIKKINSLGFSGMEKMAGIPGTIAGAVYGNAGAYGQEIKNNILMVKIFDGKKIRWISKAKCNFGYRTSVFKKNKDWIILGAEFLYKKDDPEKLAEISRDIIKLREKKYKPGLRCPGSFFKNVIFKNLPKLAREKIPADKVIYGKVPAGYLLENIGAKGITSGGIRVAKHHGNLFYNAGGGRAKDIKKLATLLKNKVFKKFGVKLEEEVQYLG